MVILNGIMLLIAVSVIILKLIMIILLVMKDAIVPIQMIICTILNLYLPTFKVSLTLLVLLMIVVGMTNIIVLDMVL